MRPTLERQGQDSARRRTQCVAHGLARGRLARELCYLAESLVQQHVQARRQHRHRARRPRSPAGSATDGRSRPARTGPATGRRSASATAAGGVVFTSTDADAASAAKSAAAHGTTSTVRPTAAPHARARPRGTRPVPPPSPTARPAPRDPPVPRTPCHPHPARPRSGPARSPPPAARRPRRRRRCSRPPTRRDAGPACSPRRRPSRGRWRSSRASSAARLPGMVTDRPTHDSSRPATSAASSDSDASSLRVRPVQPECLVRGRVQDR